MIHDLWFWLSDKHTNQLLLFLWAFLLLDVPRYVLSKTIVLIFDIFSIKKRDFSYCPSVCVIISAYNEGDNIVNSAKTLYGTYPKLQIIIIDDGSTDNSFAKVQEFSRSNENIIVLRREDRGGKASAINMGMLYNKSEVTVIADTDCSFGENALWEIVQPLKDKDVGAVSAPIMPRNSFVNFCTWFQAYEYLHNIVIGRRPSSTLGVLGIVSGAFGAFKTDVLHRIGNMDVGPPEDLDATLKIRRIGYKIVYAPYAFCYTDVPETFVSLTKQRIRWEQGGVVRNHCRKHMDMVSLLSPNFKISNLFLWMETVWFELISPFVILFYFYWLLTNQIDEIHYIVFWLFVAYFLLEVAQSCICLFYSSDLKHDILVCLISPLVLFYKTYLLFVRLYGIVSELLWKDSYNDNYVPKKVRDVTWRY